MSSRVAVDIGGTFTDLVHVDAEGRLTRAKCSSTPAALEDAVVQVLVQSGADIADVDAFIHGSTVVINAITERRGARTALVTTRGFGDVLEIGRANRPDIYNLRYRKPETFVPSELRFELPERTSYTGAEIEPLDEDAVRAVARQLLEAGVLEVSTEAEDRKPSMLVMPPASGGGRRGARH